MRDGSVEKKHEHGDSKSSTIHTVAPIATATVELSTTPALISVMDNETRFTHIYRPRTRQRQRRPKHLLACAALLSLAPRVQAQSCISLQQSTQCSAFNASSISTDSFLVGLFPFLSRVTDTASFDSGIQDYLAGPFIQLRFQQLIGCNTFNSSDPSSYYARYSTSVLCNAIIQNSLSRCGLTGRAATPLCADTCAQYTQTESDISTSALCGSRGPNAESQIRADLTNCALPARSLEGSCIPGSANERENCGFATNLGGLCSYCAAGSANSTDSCCVFSKTEQRCQGVSLPIAAALASPSASPSSTSSPTPSSSNAAGSTNNQGRARVSGGAIAGIVIGAVVFLLIVLALIVACCIFTRRRRKDPSPATSVFNQPATSRYARPLPAGHDGGESSPVMRQTQPVEALPGGRVQRLAAIEGGDAGGLGVPPGSAYGTSSSSDTPHRTPPNVLDLPSRRQRSAAALAAAGAAGAAAGNNGSDDSSRGLSSPEGTGTGQSEQLAFFKDYYSQDEMHAGDLVSTLWAYSPRANDEFELERGDMLRLVGIWDDGWATGLRVALRAENWRARDQVAHDSGLGGEEEPEGEGDVKAFPLVCVCLPQHWQRTIDGETDGSGGESFRSMSPH